MRKPQSQPALASLNEADREQLAAWLRRDSYEDVLDRVNKPRPEGFGLSISKKPLQTFYAKVALLDLINSRVPTDKKLTLATFESLTQSDILISPSPEQHDTCNLRNAPCSMNEPNPDSRSPLITLEPKIKDAHTTILQTVLDLATSADNTPTQLLNLLRLADFPARAEFRQHRLDLDRQKFTHKREIDTFRKEIAAARLDLAKQNFAFRQKQHEERLTLAREKISTRNSQPSNSTDPLGPPARNWDEVSERARIHFDVSKEEWSRRQSLHGNCDANGKNPGSPNPNPNPNLLSMESAVSSPLTLLPPANLETTVHAYTTRRAEEYWAWRRTCAALPDGEPHPDYITQYRHCPCGNPNPCPDHENETQGELPEYFWSTSPHLELYALCLTSRGLPYREPTECIPDQFRLYPGPLRRSPAHNA